MYPRIFNPLTTQSFFLFGPRGTGKSSFIKAKFGEKNYVDLLDDETYNDLLASPKHLKNYINNPTEFCVIDEVQKNPKLLDEVHRLIEKEKLTFILTGSSARKLRRAGINLLGGRALTYYLYPLTPIELGNDFVFHKVLDYGLLPMSVTSQNPEAFLQSYIRTYLKEEIQLEGLARNIANFSRFLQAASFSQAAILNVSKVASECSVERKTVEDYFSILRDLLLSIELPIFSKKAKRELITKSKFYFFDVGVFKAIHPKGPLDIPSEINGATLETLVLQTIVAMNDYLNWKYEIFFWHTKKHQEVDFILYGPKGFYAIEVKLSDRIRKEDYESLIIFNEDYPTAKRMIIYGGNEERTHLGILIIPVNIFLKKIEYYLS